MRYKNHMNGPKNDVFASFVLDVWCHRLSIEAIGYKASKKLLQDNKAESEWSNLINDPD